MSNRNNISYLNKTFSEFKDNLINYAKTYFPTTYNDFTESTPGNLFIEMASYIGDVTSFYLDTQIQETFLLYAKERENLFALSYALGYRPKISYASTATVDIFQLIPAIPNPQGVLIPDSSYALVIPENTSISAGGVKFLTIEKVDFSDLNNTDISFAGDAINAVNTDFFLLTKQVKVISAEILSTTLNFNTSQKFAVGNIINDNILQILDVTDEQNNRWYEVPYLAQSFVFDKVNNPNYSSDGVPHLLKLRRVPRRFVSRFLSNNTLQLEFGAGVANTSDNIILPNPDNIELGLTPGISNLYNNFNKASLFHTQEYGLAPLGNLTVRYLVGGGITSNVPLNTITNIDKSNISFKNNPFIPGIASLVIQSIACTNTSPSFGGRSGDTIEEIRNNTLYAYQSQLRAVTREDYMVRALSLPSEYGSVSKVFITQDAAREQLITPTVATTEGRNPLSLDMYILGYNSDKKLISASSTLKQNLASYINEFRMVTDAINIKDAFYINIGINFDVVVASGYNNNDILSKCIVALKEYFNIEKWSINQPITITDITSTLLKINGVQTITKIEIINKQGGDYSPYAYDIIGATKQGNIYPSLDPSIFEVRFPDIDIQGRVVPFVI
jgi:hypothetical protein